MDKLKIETELNAIKSFTAGISNILTFINESAEEIRTEINSGVIIPGVTFPAFTRIGVLLDAGGQGVLAEPYSPMQTDYNNGAKRFRMSYYGWGVHLSCSSQTGLPGSWLSENAFQPFNQRYGAISNKMFKGNYYQSWHSYEFPLQDRKAFRRFAKTGNLSAGFTNYDLPVDMWAGEDSSFLVEPDRLVLFVRPQLPQGNILRRTAYTESQDGLNWTPIKEINFDFTIEPNRQVYSFSVCKVKNTYIGVVNIYDVIADMVYMRIYKTKNTDFTGWTLEQNFPLNYNQQYGQIAYDETAKELILLVSEGDKKHNETGQHFKVVMYKSKVSGV